MSHDESVQPPNKTGPPFNFPSTRIDQTHPYATTTVYNFSTVGGHKHR